MDLRHNHGFIKAESDFPLDPIPLLDLNILQIGYRRFIFLSEFILGVIVLQILLLNLNLTRIGVLGDNLRHNFILIPTTLNHLVDKPKRAGETEQPKERHLGIVESQQYQTVPQPVILRQVAHHGHKCELAGQDSTRRSSRGSRRGCTGTCITGTWLAPDGGLQERGRAGPTLSPFGGRRSLASIKARRSGGSILCSRLGGRPSTNKEMGRSC